MRELYKRAAPHIDRVRLDGGVPTDNVQELLLLKRSNEELKNVLRLSYCPELHGNKIRTSGINNFITKGYDEATSNDLTQTFSANQHFLDKIAPTEKLSAKNPSGAACYLTHTPITFGTTDKWTAEIVVNWSGKSISSSHAFLFGNANAGTYAGVSAGNVNMFTPVGISSSFIIGKTYTICYVKTVNSIILYVDGVYKGVSVFDTAFTMSILNSGYNFNNNCNGNIFSYHVFSDALNAQQIAERASVLRSIFPEIPFTRIGDQIWSVRNYEAACTPQGNVIAEMQAAANVEKVVNGDFSNGTTGWTPVGSGAPTITVTDGVATLTNPATGSLTVNNSTILSVGWHKVTVNVIDKNSTAFLWRQGASNVGITLALGINTFYVNITVSGAFNIGYSGNLPIGTYITFDNVSVQQVGWSGSQELYDGIYAQTAGTVEQKTYAACKAAAMWCHYNNDATLGATYGKLYNWFAVKLLQMDIDYFNAANPTTPWGWRVPTQADFNTLATTLGGIAVAGGKMKLNDSRYWSSPNAGADNSSGFSSIGSGFRDDAGTFSELLTANRFSGIDAGIFTVSATSEGQIYISPNRLVGRSLRLIKTT